MLLVHHTKKAFGLLTTMLIITAAFLLLSNPSWKNTFVKNFFSEKQEKIDSQFGIDTKQLELAVVPQVFLDGKIQVTVQTNSPILNIFLKSITPLTSPGTQEIDYWYTVYSKKNKDIKDFMNPEEYTLDFWVEPVAGEVKYNGILFDNAGLLRGKTDMEDSVIERQIIQRQVLTMDREATLKILIGPFSQEESTGFKLPEFCHLEADEFNVKLKNVICTQRVVVTE